MPLVFVSQPHPHDIFFILHHLKASIVSSHKEFTGLTVMNSLVNNLRLSHMIIVMEIKNICLRSHLLLISKVTLLTVLLVDVVGVSVVIPVSPWVVSHAHKVSFTTTQRKISTL